MRQPMNLNCQELNELADSADALCDWLDEQEAGSPDEGRRLAIPPRLTVLATTLLIYGGPIIFATEGPMSVCWSGGCVQPK